MGLDETDDPELFGSDIDEDEDEQNDLITEDNAEFLGMLSKLGFKTERFEKKQAYLMVKHEGLKIF